MKQYLTPKESPYVSVNTLIQRKKNPGIGATPKEQKRQVPESDAPISTMPLQATRSNDGNQTPVQFNKGDHENAPFVLRKENQTGMPDDFKAGLEHTSGLDLSRVRVHRNSDKPSQIGAYAYTQGTNIYLASGQERYLPHEGGHVIQQLQGRVQATVQAKGLPVNDQPELEKEADLIGEQAAFFSGRVTQLWNNQKGAPAQSAASKSPIQCAWIGRRELVFPFTMPGWLNFNLNPFSSNTKLQHFHIFFERDNSNLGLFPKNMADVWEKNIKKLDYCEGEVRKEDDQNLSSFTKEHENLDDKVMFQAVKQVGKLGTEIPYHLVKYNCQSYANDVLKWYRYFARNNQNSQEMSALLPNSWKMDDASTYKEISALLGKKKEYKTME